MAEAGDPLLEGHALSDKLISKKQEGKLRKLARDLFLAEYPNPERNGCPDSGTIRAIVFGQLRGEQARQWRTHFATCSPCTREYADFRRQFQRSSRLRALAVIAAVVVLAVFAGWLVLTRFASRRQSWQQATLDLRGHEVFRGPQPSQAVPPLELARGRLELTLELPVGSEAGDYDVQLVEGTGHSVAARSGKARLVDGIAVLKVPVDLRHARPGPASLFVRSSGQSWNRYKIFLE